MSKHTLNIINQLLAYADSYVTDNPYQRAFDHTRRLHSLAINNPKSDSRVIPAGGSLTIFNGAIATALSGASVLNLALLSSSTSIYRLSVTAGPSGFRTTRAVSGIVACNVTLNNNALAVFDFTGATLASVQVGDIMRIKGSALNDQSPFAFNQLNAGHWTVMAVSGTQVSCVRATGEDFSGATETVAVATADVQFYSADGVQKGNKMAITGTFSPVSQRTFEVLDVTASTIDFVSTAPLPTESSITYAPSTITFYSESKKIVYLEVDQEAIVRFNGDTSDNNRVSPIQQGDQALVGFLHKVGDSYSCTVVNKSVNPLNLKYFSAE